MSTDKYEAIGVTDRVRARRLTRRALVRDFSPAGWCIFHLWRSSLEFADAHGVKDLPLADLSPRDELARQWVDRCVAIVRAWRQGVELESRRQRPTASAKARL